MGWKKTEKQSIGPAAKKEKEKIESEKTKERAELGRRKPARRSSHDEHIRLSSPRLHNSLMQANASARTTPALSCMLTTRRPLGVANWLRPSVMELKFASFF